VRRRTFVLTLGTAPLWLPACAHREETPLAHLYGKDWVHGAYEMYAGKYAAIQTSSEEASKNAYAMLARRGVTALDALQTREVPFFIRVDDGEKGFAIARNVPERLTFTADMTDADREAAQARWEKAREHIQTDYEDIRRLDWALTTLLGQLQRVRSAIDDGKIEQYRLVRQLTALSAGDKPPFELPYQVSVDGYQDVLLLLLERLDDDSKRLARVESDIVTVGLTARATDSNSGSLAANLHKVLLAVVSDAEATSPRAASFPQGSDDRDRYLARGKEIYASIRATPEYVQWEKRESTKAFDQIGQMLTVLDAMTGLHTSAIYKQLLDIWRGDADYLSYLETLVKMLPGGSEVVKVANEAIELTEKARRIAGQVQKGIALAKTAIDTGRSAVDTAKKMANGQVQVQVPDAQGVLQLAKDSGLLNAGSNFARSKLEKQLAFLKDQKELDEVKGLIGESSLVKSALPAIPGLTGSGG
jgi:hypothetical protein